MKAGGTVVMGSVDNVLVFDKLGRVEVEHADAGDIVAVVGLANGRYRRHDRRPRTAPWRCLASRSTSRP